MSYDVDNAASDLFNIFDREAGWNGKVGNKCLMELQSRFDKVPDSSKLDVFQRFLDLLDEANYAYDIEQFVNGPTIQ